MNIVARIKLSDKLKDSSSEIGYYSYTNRCATLKQTIEHMSENYEIIPAGEPISKSGIENLLDGIRPIWKGKNLIQRVTRLLPNYPSSACQP
jgi:hypothetical protein